MSVEIDIGTVAIAELAAAHHGMPVTEWIANVARHKFACISPGPNHVEPTEAERGWPTTPQQAADEATRFRAAAPPPLLTRSVTRPAGRRVSAPRRR